MKHGLPWLISCTMLILLAACSQRERTNPLDPRHPETGGRPQYIHVSSQRQKVTVSWSESNISDMIYVYVERAVGDAAFEAAAKVPPDIKEYIDTDISYDLTYRYRISFSGADWQTAPSDTVTITPGPFNFWVTDYQAGTLSRLTYDTAHVLFATPFAFFPRDVAVDTLRLQVWAADWTGFLLRQGLNGKDPLWIDGFKGPSRLLHDGHSVWVVQNGLSELMTVSPEGQITDSLKGFNEIADLASDGQGGMWVADAGDSALVHVLPAGGVERHRLARSLVSMAAMPEAEGFWLGADNHLGRFNAQGVYEGIITLPGKPVALSALDAGRCWVLIQHVDGSAVAWLVNSGGEVLTEAGGFMQALDIEAVPHERGCVVVDYGNRRIVRLSIQGEVIGQRGGFMTPERIVLE